MCTVLLRYAPGAPWPILAAAVRDEFVERAWDPPAEHWGAGGAQAEPGFGGAEHPQRLAGVLGGLDRVAGGTWLAVRPETRALAAVLNGARLLAADDPARRSRGSLPLAAVRGEPLPDREQLPGFDGFHLVRATPAGVAVLTWDGDARHERQLAPGDHVIVNRGVDVPDDPVVARFLPALRATPSPDPGAGKSTVDAWADWVELAAGGGLDPAQPGALLVRREYAGHAYGSTSVSLVALAPGAVRYDFSGSPWDRDAWRPVLQPE